jgi:arginyl-tRNA synthetase
MAAAPPEDPRTRLAGLLAGAVHAVAPDHAGGAILLERPKLAEHGDYACSVALQLAKALKRPPREIAARLVAALPASPDLEKAEVAGAGFINLFLARSYKQGAVNRILAAGERYGRSEHGQGEKVQVEFVSANPTGPLHVGHGRQAALGDAIAALLQAQGYDAKREYYYNDAGVQIQNLAVSVQARARGLKPGDELWPPDAYKGDYIQDIAEDFLARKSVRTLDGREVRASGEIGDANAVREFAVAYLRYEQDMDLQAFGVKFDVYYLESSLYTDGKVADTVRALIASGKTYEQDGALWLRTTEYGDDKDRVMRKSDGSYTYFVPDVAYHVTKWRRGFRKAINVQGTDHHGTVARVRAGLQALDLRVPQGYPDYVLHNMVKVMRDGAEVKISKRAGSYVTLRDLMDWVGRDAVRFFLVSRQPNSEFTFDVDLARARSEENPVYYVQYAHARVCSVFEQWGGDTAALPGVQASPLVSGQESALLARLMEYPEAVQDAARDLAPHVIAFYLRELAAEFHSYYNTTRILVEDSGVKLARLALAGAVREVLRNGLSLLGVSAPEKM